MNFCVYCGGPSAGNCGDCKPNSVCQQHLLRCSRCGQSSCVFHSGQKFKKCEFCTQSICSAHTDECKNCKKCFCPSHGSACITCKECFCSTHSTSGGTCSICRIYYCSAHSNFTTCKGCSKSCCATCVTPSCASCQQSYCNYCRNAISTCGKCNKTFCKSHTSSPCSSCRIILCSDHGSTCASCGSIYCPEHLPKHTNNRNLVYCIDQSAYGKYESPINLRPTQDGVGTFVWPNGQRTMCWFYDGKLMLSQNITAQEQSEIEFTEEKREYEKYKRDEEIKWKDAQEKQRETNIKMIAKEKDDFSSWKAEEELKLQEATQKLAGAKKIFEDEREKGRKFIYANKGPIKLNIGGAYFQTTVSSLSKFPSMLSTMFNGSFEVEKDDSGAVFIDRDGTHFRHILNFIRDGSLPSNLSKDVQEALLTEANYYQMDELTNALKNLSGGNE